MKQYDSAEIYETEINGETYCFRYPDPQTRNGGRTFSGVAVAWKKGSDDSFTVPFYVKADEIDRTYFKIIEGISAHVNG